MTRTEPNGRRGCLIAGSVVFVALLARNCGQQGSTSHPAGADYVVPANAIACESLSEINRMVDLLSDATDDHIAARKFMAVSTCHWVQQPTPVILESLEGFDFARVRARGGIVSWYMLRNELK